MVINTNVSSLVSRRLLSESTGQLSKSLAKLSAGSRILSPEADAAGLAQSLKLSTQVNRNRAVSDNIANAISTLRAKVGANIARLEMTKETLAIQNENLTAANSRIADVDVARESTHLARYNILTQSGTAMLAQANLLPQSVLRLLG